ncbi:phage major capsid protein [Adlercreutzia sp. ZJ138]|uniref:phage major capsid protein n=1 Tax=Adlercreutzia sp. ZJ138 TaxID=2709405 RepID=UPI0013ED759C|nr:phage major capsid protein [Adlercreutzia sp. ZJ138]
MATKVELNTDSFGQLPEELSSDIIAKTVEASAFMQLARQISLPSNGTAIPVITGEPEAKWIGETEKAPTSEHTGTLKHIQASKISVIEVFSNEFRRDLPGLYGELARRLPYSLSKKFDETVIGTVEKPNNNFDNLSSCTRVNIADKTYQSLVDADTAVAVAGYMGDGYALAPQAKGILLSAVDGNKRPLFINNTVEGAIPMILGNKAVVARGVYGAGDETHANICGVFGDWTKAMYGTVDGINVEIDKSATVNGVNLFEQGMFAVKVTAELGFAIADEDAFVVLTDGTDTTAGA